MSAPPARTSESMPLHMRTTATADPVLTFHLIVLAVCTPCNRLSFPAYRRRLQVSRLHDHPSHKRCMHAMLSRSPLPKAPTAPEGLRRKGVVALRASDVGDIVGQTVCDLLGMILVSMITVGDCLSAFTSTNLVI